MKFIFVKIGLDGVFTKGTRRRETMDAQAYVQFGIV
jgi:hypothetical protein